MVAYQNNYLMSKIRLVNKSGVEIDLHGFMDLLAIYDSINQHFITASLIVKMSVNTLIDKNIETGNKLIVELKHDKNTKTFNFILTDIEVVDQDRDLRKNSGSFVFHLITSKQYEFNNKLFVKKYESTPQKILENELGIKFIKNDYSLESVSLVGMNWNLGNFIKTVTKYAIGSGFGYMMFENFNGFNFINFDELISQPSILTMKYTNIGFGMNFDNLIGTYTRGSNNLRSSANPENNIGVFKFIKDNFENEIVLNNYDNKVVSVYEREIFNSDSGNYQSKIEKLMKNKLRLMDIPNMDSLSLSSCVASFEYTSGKSINIEMPNTIKADYLILSVKHVFEAGSIYKSNLNLIKK